MNKVTPTPPIQNYPPLRVVPGTTVEKVKNLLLQRGISAVQIHRGSVASPSSAGAPLNLGALLPNDAIVTKNDRVTGCRDARGSSSSSSSSSGPRLPIALIFTEEVKEEKKAATPAASSNPHLLIRRFKEAIERVAKVIESSNLKDQTTVILKQRWLPNIKKAFAQYLNPKCKMSVDEMKAQMQVLIKQAQELASDPFRVRLDEKALLGSDGYAYDPMSLALIQDQMPSAHKGRSPMRPNDPTPLQTSPHEPIRAVAQWLRSIQALPDPPPRLIEDFNKLQQKKPVVEEKKSVDQQEEKKLEQRVKILDLLIEDSDEDENEPAVNPNAPIPQGANLIDILLQEPSSREVADAPQGPDMVAVERALKEMEDEQAARQEAFLKNLQARGEALARDNRVEAEARLQQLSNDIEALEARIARANAEAAEGIQENLAASQNLNVLDQQSAQLRQEIKEAEKEIKKQKRNQLIEVAKVAAIVGACVLASYAAGPLLAEFGASIGIAPTVGGGAKGSIAFGFL